MEISKHIDIVLDLLETKDINNIDVIDRLKEHKSIYKSIIIKALKQEPTYNYSFELNYNHLISPRGYKNVNYELFRNKKFALYCLEKDGRLLRYFEYFYNDREVVLSAIASENNGFGFSIINICADNSEHNSTLQYLYSNDIKFIKIMVKHTYWWLKKYVKMWVITNNPQILKFIDNEDNYARNSLYYIKN